MVIVLVVFVLFFSSYPSHPNDSIFQSFLFLGMFFIFLSFFHLFVCLVLLFLCVLLEQLNEKTIKIAILQATENAVLFSCDRVSAIVTSRRIFNCKKKKARGNKRKKRKRTNHNALSQK